MTRKYRIFLLSCCIAAGMSVAARAEDPVGGMVADFIKGLGGALTDELKHDMETKRLESHAVAESGYCQVWRNGQLAVQRACGAKYFCDTEGVCTHQYRWPTGRVSELILKDEVPVSINGHESGLALVGSDECVKDGTQAVFCYTRAKQMANLAVTITPVSSVPAQQDATATTQDPKLINIVTPPTVTPISLPSSDTNTDIIVQGPLMVPAQSTMASKQSGTQAVSQPQNVPEVLLAQFVAALENKADPASKAKRCALGPTLLTVYGSEFDDETKSYIHGQLVQDGCS